MPDETTARESAAKLWRRYLAVTLDMQKMFDKDDLDMFMELVEQRDGLIKQIDAVPENDFRTSDEFAKIVETIKPIDMQLLYRAKTWLNKSRHQTSAVRSYDVRTYGGVGGILNREY